MNGLLSSLLLLSLASLCLTSDMSPQEEANSHLFSEAFQLMGRAASTSEVLSLNITNLLILLGLKFVIFAFGLFTGGGVGGGNTASVRSMDSDSNGAFGGLLSQSDMTGGMCFMMYAAGDPEKLSCLMRTACEDPELAMEYVTAARMWHKVHTFVK